jgi:DNA-binding response OmpR family regulator
VLLELEGHEIRIAFDGVGAFEVSDDFHPQVMILDISMPGQDGCAVARLVRKRPWGVTAHLIALTGWDTANVRTLAREAGFDRYITKPDTLKQRRRCRVVPIRACYPIPSFIPSLRR